MNTLFRLQRGAILLALALCACGPSGPDIQIRDAWVRPDPLMENAAGYLVIRNEGDDLDALIGVEAEFVGAAQLHRTVMEEGGIHRMVPVTRLEVPAGGQVKLEPLSYHFMLMNIQEDLDYGQTVTLVLEFEKSGRITVEAEVRQE